jgi:hypothetical protein
MAATKINNSGVTFPDSTVQSTAITTGNVGYKLMYSGTLAFYYGEAYQHRAAYGVEYRWLLKTSGASVLQSLSPSEFNIVTSVSGGFTTEAYNGSDGGLIPYGNSVFKRNYTLGEMATKRDSGGGDTSIDVNWPITIYSNPVATNTWLIYKHIYTEGNYGIRKWPNYLNIKVYVMNLSVIDSVTYVSQANRGDNLIGPPGPSSQG